MMFKTLAFLVAAVALAVPGALASRRHRYWQEHLRVSAGVGPTDQWFTQQLDHFDASAGTFQQRYQVNGTFYRPGGPLFLMLGGEGPASGGWLGIDTAIMDYAQEHGAVVAQIEHRFYGKTQPLPDLSVASLKYLSSEQALADAAVFVGALREQLKLPAATKVVSFGGSYSGALSAWLRAKYPHVVDAAISTSSPVLAQLNFVAYQEVVGASLATTPNGAACVARIADGMSKIAELLGTAAGREALTAAFQLCPDADLTSQLDMSNFASTIAGNFDGVVQYARDNRNFEGGAPPPTMEDVCALMVAPEAQDPVLALAAVNTLLLAGQNCTDVSYAAMIAQLRNETFDPANNMRQWTYQTCVEFGYFQSTDAGATQQPFGTLFPLPFSLQQCQDAFGLAGPNTAWTNTNYGGLDIQATNVAFVNGKIDPWHILSVTTPAGQPDSNIVILMNSTAHCANMYPPGPNDAPELTAARKTISAAIGKWIQ